ncbi:SHOCT domain-containing protein [Halovenus halobia]|uniref:SHOCT domain-containing protein n=1 Tax=Halovenus halobia TaxID=3396622 RepID=UPI003F557F04
MSDDSFRARATANASGIAATIVTGTWLALLMLDFPSEIWLAVMLFGYIAVVPVISMLFDEDDAEATTDQQPARSEAESDSEDALERLRRRYAEGELTDEQFERKLERLLETETLEAAEDQARARNRAAQAESDDPIAERE